jgi:hypothetical protein
VIKPCDWTNTVIHHISFFFEIPNPKREECSDEPRVEDSECVKEEDSECVKETANASKNQQTSGEVKTVK